MFKTFIFASSLVLGILLLPQGVSAQQATLSFSPSSQVVQQGSTFTVQVNVNSGSTFVNAVAAYFSYPANLLDVVQVSTTGSVLQFVAESTGSQGTVRLSGGKPTPGFAGSQVVGQVQFRAKTSGTATLTWNSDSAVLTDQGNQNILSLATSPTATFQLGAGGSTPPPVPTPSPTPTPNPTPGPSPSPTPGSPTPSPSPTTVTPQPIPETDDIFNIALAEISPNTYILSWETRNAAESELFYGVSSLVASGKAPFSILDKKLLTQHTAVLRDVESPEQHSVQIVAIDAAGSIEKSAVISLGLLLDVGTPSPTPGSGFLPTAIPGFGLFGFNLSLGEGFEVAGVMIPVSPLALAIGIGVLLILIFVVVFAIRRR